MEGTSSSSTTHDYHVEEEIFPISDDEKYAEEIQLQQVLIFSAISNTNKEIQVVDVDEIHNVNNTLLRKLKLKEQETFEGESSSSSSSQLKQYSYCGICMETKSIEEMFENRNCSHSFCEECVGKYLVAKIEENISMIKCPDPKCNAMLVNDEKEVVTVAECPHCHRLFCAECKVSWHVVSMWKKVRDVLVFHADVVINFAMAVDPHGTMTPIIIIHVQLDRLVV
ncbi:RBR-type E3 ubiquitin transferase [Trifolium repens]|nr:RBR-type E3 ubiquitin transferase [Trifolium repens]